MCDFTHILTLFGIAEIALVGVGVAIGIAVAANSSVFGAPAGTAAFAGAMIAYIAAIAFVDSARGNLAFPHCTSANCASAHAAAVTAFRDLEIAMGAAVVAAGAATLASWIPIAGAIGMIATGVAIVAVGALLPIAARALSALQSCLTAAPPTTGATVVEVIAVVIDLFFVGAALGLFGQTRNPDNPLGPKD
jgi:hypothetical protein